MEKIIIINYGVLDLSNPNAACIYELALYLQKEFEIHFFTNSLEPNEISFQKRGEINIHSLPVKKSFGRKIIDINSQAVTEYIDNLQLENVSACISVSFPFLPTVKVLGVLKRKHFKNTRRIIYELDPLAFNGAAEKSLVKFLLRLLYESIEFSKADSIWLTRELYEDYKKGIYKVFGRKMMNIGIPLLSNRNYELYYSGNSEKRRFIKLVYAGTFYDNIRKPDYLVEIIKNITEVIDIQLHIYGNVVGQKSYQLLQDAKEELGDKLIIHGTVERNKIPEVLSDADFLINVGNSISNQAPSKIFEYIETGKPIINFSSIKNDSSQYYLERYPFSLSILESWDEKDIIDNSKNLIEFCNSNLNKLHDKKEIIEMYKECTTGYIAEKAINSIYSIK